MILNHCIIKFESTGICHIDMKKALKSFTKRCLISKYHEKYTLCRITHKRHFSMKAAISIEVARTLIDRLDLVEHKSAVLRYGSTFLMKETDLNNI